MGIVETPEKKETKVGEFYCPDCNKRADLCKCDKYKDRGCWDCDQNCKVDNRRKLKKSLEEFLATGKTLPKELLGLDHLFQNTKTTSPCCEFPLRKILLKVVVSDKIVDEQLFFVCPLCQKAYRFF
jgi:hypothetical protein